MGIYKENETGKKKDEKAGWVICKTCIETYIDRCTDRQMDI